MKRPAGMSHLAEAGNPQELLGLTPSLKHSGKRVTGDSLKRDAYRMGKQKFEPM